MRKMIGNLQIDDGGPETDLPAVLLLHSCGGSLEHFGAQLAHLRTARRAVAVDLPGHGGSALPPDEPVGFAAFAGELATLMDRLRLDRAVVVGHSMGGSVAVALAAAHPQRVAGLMLLDPSADGRSLPAEMTAPFMAALRDEATYWPTLEGYYAPMVQGSAPAVRQLVLGDLRRAAPRVVIAAFDELLRFDPATPLRNYRGPKWSLITPLNEEPGSLQNLDPTLRAVKIDGTSHWPHLDKPEEVNAVISRFLDAM